jgi:hypothetical protein
MLPKSALGRLALIVYALLFGVALLAVVSLVSSIFESEGRRS